MTTPAFDPADTLSGVIPSLPPVPYHDDGGPFDPASWPMPASSHAGLSVLDPRFPIELEQPPHIFWQQISEWPDRETVIGQTIRATQQHTIPEVRFVQPLPPLPLIDVSPAALPPPAIPVLPYRELAEPVLAREWDTGPGTAILAGPPSPQRHRHRGAGGRFAREAS